MKITANIAQTYRLEGKGITHTNKMLITSEPIIWSPNQTLSETKHLLQTKRIDKLIPRIKTLNNLNCFPGVGVILCYRFNSRLNLPDITTNQIN